jgi:hypothetical protein
VAGKRVLSDDAKKFPKTQSAFHEARPGDDGSFAGFYGAPRLPLAHTRPNFPLLYWTAALENVGRQIGIFTALHWVRAAVAFAVDCTRLEIDMVCLL